MAENPLVRASIASMVRGSMAETNRLSIVEGLRDYIKLKRDRMWVKRFVVLEAGSLYYFKTPASIKPRCFIKLQGSRISKIGMNKSDFILQLTKQNEVNLKLAFSSEAMMNLWYDAISSQTDEGSFGPDGQICLLNEERASRDKQNWLLMKQINILPLQALVEQKLKLLMEKNYRLVGLKGDSEYYKIDSPNKTKQNKGSGFNEVLFVILIYGLVNLADKYLGCLFLLGACSYLYFFRGGKPSSRRESFKCMAVFKSTVGEILSTLHDWPCREGWEPFLSECSDGYLKYFNYSGKQYITREFYKDSEYYFMVEKAEDTIKNVFRLEEKLIQGDLATQVTHYGEQTENQDPFVGNPDILSSLKCYVESTSLYLSEHSPDNSLVLDKIDSEFEEEMKNNVEDLGLTPDTPFERKMQIESWNLEALEAMKEAEQIDEETEGWEIIKLKTNSVQGTRRKGAKGLYIIRGMGVIEKPVEEIIEFLKDLDNKPQYDEMYELGHVIDKISENMEVVYEKYKKETPTEPRDFCMVERRFNLPDGSVVAVATSVEHPECPETKFVRAELYLGCFILNPVGTNSTRVTYIVNVDIKGSVPKFIINSVENNEALVVEKLKNAMQGEELKDF